MKATEPTRRPYSAPLVKTHEAPAQPVLLTVSCPGQEYCPALDQCVPVGDC